MCVQFIEETCHIVRHSITAAEPTAQHYSEVIVEPPAMPCGGFDDPGADGGTMGHLRDLAVGVMPYQTW